MRKIFTTFATIALLGMTACQEDTTKFKQAQKSEAAANSIDFSDNNEIANISKRHNMFSKPGTVSYILLMNQMGSPIYYAAIQGKPTSSTKRLTSPQWFRHQTWLTAPSDDGTYGSSDPYIYFWTTAGQYFQWNGPYLISDKPFRTTVPVLVIEEKVAQ